MTFRNALLHAGFQEETILQEPRPMRLLFFLAAALAWPTQLRVEIRESEVWLIRDGHEYQLTHDGKSKLHADLSDGQNRIAYYEQCPEAEHCMPAIVILDLQGHRIVSFQPKHHADPPLQPRSSLLSLAWIGASAVAAVCL